MTVCKLTSKPVGEYVPPRCAVFTATAGGVRLALRVRETLGTATPIFVKAAPVAPSIKNCVSYKKLSVAVQQAFCRYDALIFIMAAGIVVRVIAPHVCSKLSDPAVVVLDECGKHVISLLSGHVGGANDLTGYLADFLHSDPVITTATDTRELLAPDAVAGRLALDPWPKDNIRRINTALLAGENITWLLAANLPHRDFWQSTLAETGIIAHVQGDGLPAEPFVLLTTQSELPRPDILALTPCDLIAGVGCRRGTTAAEIMAALADACRRVNRDVSFITALATAAIKRDEPGLQAVAAARNIPFYCADNNALQRQIDRYRLSESAFVRRSVGVGNVAEAAALAYWHRRRESCDANSGRFALAKTKYEKVTVALLWNNPLKAKG